MALDPKKIAALKRKLLEATDFTETAELFLDDLGNDLAFVSSGKPYHDRTFLTALAQAAAAARGTTGGVYKGTHRRIAEHRLIHGGFTFEGWTGMMFYFEDVAQGFMALGDEQGPSKFVRFSLITSPDGKVVKIH